MRVGISGTHGTGKTTLAGALCQRLPGHALADEPYYLLADEGYEFSFPPSPEDYLALLARSVQSLRAPQPAIVFDRTPLDYLAYLAAVGPDLAAIAAGPADEAAAAAIGVGPAGQAAAAALQPAFASLDLLVITMITAETEHVLPPADLPGLRAQMNDALLDLVHDDPLDAWPDLPILELDGPLDGRLAAVLAAQAQLPPRAP
jgi:hypothetical protein